MGFSNFIKNLTKSVQKPPFDPSIFDHPLALKTEWSPKAGGGSNFKTHTLKKVSNTELRYEGSTFGKIFAGIFMLFPLIFIGIGVTTLVDQSNFLGIVFILFPMVFIAIGFFLFKKMNTPIIFDKGAGYFFKGKNKPTQNLNQKEDKNTIKLERIQALQIVSERVRSKNSSYTSYEINFVFEDGSRYNIVDHGKRNIIETDAVTLSDFLGVPVWNKVSETSYIPKNITAPATNSAYDSVNRYDTPESSYEEPISRSSSSDNLDEPYDSMKRREL